MSAASGAASAAASKKYKGRDEEPFDFRAFLIAVLTVCLLGFLAGLVGYLIAKL